MSMSKKQRITRRLEFREAALEKLYAAYDALANTGVKSYMIDDRQLTRFDLPEIKEEIEKLEAEIDGLENQLQGCASRRAVGVIPRDW